MLFEPENRMVNHPNSPVVPQNDLVRLPQLHRLQLVQPCSCLNVMHEIQNDRKDFCWNLDNNYTHI